MKVEMQFFGYFFSASVKKVRSEIIKVFLFVIATETKIPITSGTSAEKIQRPTFFLLLKLVVVPPLRQALGSDNTKLLRFFNEWVASCFRMFYLFLPVYQ